MVKQKVVIGAFSPASSWGFDHQSNHRCITDFDYCQVLGTW